MCVTHTHMYAFLLGADSVTDCSVLLTCFNFDPFLRGGWAKQKQMIEATLKRDPGGGRVKIAGHVFSTFLSHLNLLAQPQLDKLMGLSMVWCNRQHPAPISLPPPALDILVSCACWDCFDFLLVSVEISWPLLSSCLCFALLLWKDGVQPEFRTFTLRCFQDRYRMDLLDNVLIVSRAGLPLTNYKEHNCLETCVSAMPTTQK